MSLMYVMTYLLNMSLKLSLIKYWNIEALESPYGMKQYSKWPEMVLKAVFHIYPSLMHTKL